MQYGQITLKAPKFTGRPSIMITDVTTEDLTEELEYEQYSLEVAVKYSRFGASNHTEIKSMKDRVAFLTEELNKR